MDQEQAKKLKEQLDKSIGDQTQQTLLDLIEEIKKVNLLTPKEKQEELQALYDKVSQLTETKTDTLIEAVKELSSITKEIKLELPEKLKVLVENQPEYPTEIKVSNLKDPIPYPTEIALKKPAWLEQITTKDLYNAVESVIKVVAGTKIDLEKYREPKNALAVRLVDKKGQGFYEAFAAVSGGFGGGSFPFETSSNIAKAALVDAQGHVQVDILSGGAGTQYTEGSTDATITGTAMMWEDVGDTLRAISASNPLPINIVSFTAGGSVTVDSVDFDIRDLSQTQDSILVYGSDDGGTTKRVIKTDAGGAVQVDIESIPSVTVTATNLDIRDLTSVSDSVAAVQSGNWDINDISKGTQTNDVKVTLDSETVELGAGTATIGKLGSNSGVDIGDVDVTSVVPGIAASNLGKAEDAVHTSGDVGVMALGVRNDALTSLAADGDYHPFSFDNHGGLINAPEHQVSLDELTATSGWGVINDDTLNLETTKDHIIGTDAVEFDKVDGAGNTVFAGIEKTISSVDLSIFHFHETIHTAVNISSLSNVDYAWIRIGTDSSNYNEWRIQSDDLTTGWQIMKFTIGNPSSAGSTGNGWNPAAVTYIAVGLAFNSQSNSLADIGWNHLAFHSSQHTIADIVSQVSTAVSSPNVRLNGYGGSTDTGAGNSSANTLRVVNATNDVNLAAIKTAVELIDDAAATIASTDVLRVALFDDADNQITAFSGGTQYTEDVVTANPQVGTATMIERDDQLAAVTPAEGDWIGLRGTEKGALWVALADASGDPITAFGGGTEYTEDVVTANPQVGKAIMVERDDALSAVTPAEGDWIGLRGTAEGALWTQDFNSDAILADTAAMVVDLAAIEALAITIDADTSSMNTDLGTIAGAVAGTEMQVDIVTDQPKDRTVDNMGVGLQTDAIMNDTTALIPKFAVIDDALSGNNTLIAAVAAKKIRVLAVFLVSAGTVNARFESGANGTALTGQMNLVANSGFTLPFNPVGWFETGSNTLLNLELSAAISVDGCITYVEV